ncbi:MAG: amino acid adenylation domain-containing protein, partial [Chloroflexi bacterium]
APVPEIELPQISLRPLDTDKGVATYDITLIMAETPDGLVGTFEYNQDLFDAATMERMAGHLGVVLTAVADDLHQPIAILPLLTEFERSQLLLDWNDTSHPYPLDQPIHRLIEAQVERTPEQIAVYHEGQGWTYAEFNQRANQLAHHLQTCGVGKNDIVGIYMNRCNELILAMFAIHKAGAAYLPLDPTYPAERINFMIEDAQPKVVITEEAVSSQLLAISQGNKQQKTENGKQKTTPHSQLTINNSQLIINNSQLIILSSDWSQFANLPTTNLPIVRLSAHDEASHSPNSLAYVIYTSGSTGKPKGVLLHHRGLCNLAQAYVDQLDLGPGQRLLQFFSQGFDGSVGDIFSSLISGSTLYLPRRETLLNLIELHRYLQKHAITHILMTPSMLRVLPTDNLPALKYVLAGGEQFTREIVSRWLPERRAVNAYGPTESTVVSIFHSCDTIDELPETAVSMPIGRPAPNTQVYILDQNQQPVPIGTPGELYIGGVGVAHGYLNRPELTAERFVTLAEPLSDNSQRTTDNGQRTTVYRTGDLCRWLPNGTIDFLGRIDHQVKIRGFRVELGEIEAVLEQHDGVQTAVLIIHEQDNNQQLVNKQLVNKQLVNKQLVAYVEPQQAPAPTPQALHHFLSEKLPAYMIPSIFITLDSIPKLPNGKLNRRVLPEPSGDYGETAGSYAPPRTPTEEIIAAIWAEVLNVSQVGIQDNFFELGGHSLMATQLLSRIREAFQIELPLQTLFTNPTIAALAPHIDTALQKDSTVSAPPITPVSREQTLPLSFAQQRLWYLHQLNPNSPEYNVPDAVRLNGRLHIPALETSLNHIIQRHELLRTTFVTVDGQPHLQIANTLPLTLPVIDLQHLPPDAREAESMQFVAAEAKRPFDLTTGPLLRVTLLKFDATDHLVLLTMHHIISDGWSMGVFIRELGEGYTAVLHKQPIHLPTLPIQYADFAHWQRTWLQDDVLNNQLAYWQKQLSDAPPLLELPTDRPRPAIQTGNGSYAEFTLSTELTATLKSLSQKEGTTLFMTLLAAFQTLLYRYTNQPDISIGTPIANRNRAEIEGLIGFFINTLVLRTDLHDTPTFLDLLQRVRTVALEAYAHQDVPFDKIVDAIQPERKTSHTPLFQVMFILQNAP